MKKLLLLLLLAGCVSADGYFFPNSDYSFNYHCEAYGSGDPNVYGWPSPDDSCYDSELDTISESDSNYVYASSGGSCCDYYRAGLMAHIDQIPVTANRVTYMDVTVWGGLTVYGDMDNCEGGGIYVFDGGDWLQGVEYDLSDCDDYQEYTFTDIDPYTYLQDNGDGTSYVDVMSWGVAGIIGYGGAIETDLYFVMVYLEYDSCYPPIDDDWYVMAADNCICDETLETSYNMILDNSDGGGTFTVGNGCFLDFTGSGQTITITSGTELIIQSGGLIG